MFLLLNFQDSVGVVGLSHTLVPKAIMPQKIEKIFKCEMKTLCGTHLPSCLLIHALKSTWFHTARCSNLVLRIT